MIAPDVVAKVKRLLGEGMAHRATACAVGVNRGTVGMIARGRRPDYEALRRKEEEPERSKIAQRCPECHSLVYLPCVACNTRKEAARQPPFFDYLEEPLGLELKGQHRLRYEKIHARRLRADAALEEPTLGFLSLLKTIQEGRREKRIAVDGEIESCFDWPGLPARPTLHRRQPVDDGVGNRRTLARWKVAEVHRLLREGMLNQRAIARLTGVGPASVSAIATGKRPDYEGLRPRLREM